VSETVGTEGRGNEPIHPQPATPIEPTPSKPRSELVRRLLTASVLIPSIVYVIVLGGLPFLATVVGIVLLALHEFYGMIEAKGAMPLKRAGLAAGASLPVVAYLGDEYHTTILMTASLLGVMIAQLGKARIGEALASISGTFFGLFYVGWLLSHAVVLRQFHHVVESKWGAQAAAGIAPQTGVFLMLFCVTSVVACDAGAYFAGRAYGRRKLAPKISPNKTIEGGLGGLLGGMLAGLIVKLVFDSFWPELSSILTWGLAAALGLVVSVAGVIGDLIESLLKRDAAQKDTGALLPGMGGVLDRIDSNLIAIPVMYYLMLAVTFVRMSQA
jgi:phosphatidate cytidylyltransferase